MLKILRLLLPLIFCTPVFAEKIPIKVVVIALFEVGAATGDKPGEFQLWAERYPLPEKVALPHGHYDLYLNRQEGVLGLVTGVGTAKSAASTMALGLDPRFDFTDTYWVLAGISGFDPQDASLGSVCVADYVVDGDLLHTIDIREAPDDWSTGKFPFRAKSPYQKPKPENLGSVFALDKGLSNWAFALTEDLELMDSEALEIRREKYTGYPNAQKPPFVLQGAYLAGMNYWHGKIENEWANEWVSYWTDGNGEFVASAMEGTGVMTSLEFLNQAGIVNSRRVIMLRSASNYTMQWPGGTAYQSKSGEAFGTYSAFIPSIENVYKVGQKIVHELVSNWNSYQHTIPQKQNQ